MTVTATLYGGFLESLANKQVNLNSDTFHVMLLGSGYTPSDAHRYQSDLGSNEIAGTGYTAGGQALEGTASSYASNTLTFTADNISWTDSTIAAQYAAIVDVTPGAAASNPIVGYVNFGAVISDTNGVFEIDWNAAGIFQITHS
ncbi:hypothetical protein JF780_05850 [Mycobacterium intracellulare]|uniref:hypothetical protein n=1 Tax=Mycobacterium intracellulare TaxID=1767 RepID=UPI001927993A|nr:hypothetical protein [Mycobacterium intracellulare]MCA2275515.1 hypothetical protein [Mycobacterium intracellulare]MCA2324475.1 hypothetical protein [Mycobacterium intracellulare]BCP29618.1 hypothetical protein MINTM026_05880 [Mycobacterium intracellulare]